MKKILGIGDNTVDLYVNKGMMYPGGNAVNVAVHSRRCGVESAYLGCLGMDRAGSLIYDSLVSEQVDVSHCRRLEGNNSWSRIIHNGNDRVFDGHDPGVRNQYNLQESDFDYIRTFDLAHSSIYSGLESELEQLDRVIPLISFDFSDSSDLSYIKSIASYIGIAFLSADKGSEKDNRKLAQLLHSIGPNIVVITQGEHGALAYDGSSYQNQSIVQTDVVDTLGAGDGFITGFIVDYLEHKNIQTALSRGALEASKVCSLWGAFGYGEAFPVRQAGV
jgi:fructoselysine 6-kinase